MSTKEPVAVVHEFNLDLGCEKAFETAFNLWVFGEIVKIVDVKPDVEGKVSIQAINAQRVTVTSGGGDILVEAWIMDAWGEADVDED